LTLSKNPCLPHLSKLSPKKVKTTETKKDDDSKKLYNIEGGFFSCLELSIFSEYKCRLDKIIPGLKSIADSIDADIKLLKETKNANNTQNSNSNPELGQLTVFNKDNFFDLLLDEKNLVDDSYKIIRSLSELVKNSTRFWKKTDFNSF